MEHFFFQRMAQNTIEQTEKKKEKDEKFGYESVCKCVFQNSNEKKNPKQRLKIYNISLNRIGSCLVTGKVYRTKSCWIKCVFFFSLYKMRLYRMDQTGHRLWQRIYFASKVMCTLQQHILELFNRPIFLAIIHLNSFFKPHFICACILQCLYKFVYYTNRTNWQRWKLYDAIHKCLISLHQIYQIERNWKCFCYSQYIVLQKTQ